MVRNQTTTISASKPMQEQQQKHFKTRKIAKFATKSQEKVANGRPETPESNYRAFHGGENVTRQQPSYTTVYAGETGSDFSHRGGGRDSFSKEFANEMIPTAGTRGGDVTRMEANECYQTSMA